MVRDALGLGPRAPHHEASGAKRLVEIGLKILDILKPDGEADAAIDNADLGALLRRQPLMRGGRRVRDEALGVAEIVGDLEDLERVHETEGVTLPTLHLESDHGTAASHLPLGELSLRMIVAPWIEHADDFFSLGEKIGDCRRRRAMALDAQGQRLESLEQHPGVERAERRAGLLEVGVQHILDELLGPENHAAEAPSLAVDML